MAHCPGLVYAPMTARKVGLSGVTRPAAWEAAYASSWASEIDRAGK